MGRNVTMDTEKTSRKTKKPKLIMGAIKFIVCIAVFSCGALIITTLRSLRHTLEIPKLKQPVIMWYTNIDPHLTVRKQSFMCNENERTISCEVSPKNSSKRANAYVFYGSKIVDMPARERNTIFGLIHEEAPRMHANLMHTRNLNLFNYSSTFSLHSDVPFPLIFLRAYSDIFSREYFVPTTLKNKMLKYLAPVLYIQTNCQSSTERDIYVKELMKYIKVDSYGKCLNNRTPFYKSGAEVRGMSYVSLLYDPEVLRFLAKYKFIIAIENGVCNSYITEKLWRPIFIGVVPIYFGAPNIRDWLPNNKSAILVANFATPKQLSIYLKKLLENDTMYEEYLQHKVKGKVKNKRILSELESRPYQSSFAKVMNTFLCRICKRLHEDGNDVRIVNKRHYDCPLPISVLNQTVNPSSKYVNEVKRVFAEVNHLHKINLELDA